MLGSEYNWLISLHRSSHGRTRVRMASDGLLTLTIAVFCFLAVALHAAPPAPAGADGGGTWDLPDMDGIIEGVAIHPVTGEAFFSDIHNRCIWSRDVRGGTAVMKRFSADSDGLLGVYALKIDASGQTLWASSSALPEMKGYTAADAGRGFLACYDLTTRRLRRTHDLPADGRTHVLGDFLLAPDGTVYVTDSSAPVIWRLAPGGDRLENWLENAEFKSLQGIAASADGQSLYVSDYTRGLWLITRATHAATLLPAPAGANFRGIDGLYSIPGGLIAVQNGLNPPRILRIALDPAGVPAGARELQPAHATWTDLSLGQIVDARFRFIGHSGWDLFPTPDAAPPPHLVQLLNLPLN